MNLTIYQQICKKAKELQASGHRKGQAFINAISVCTHGHRIGPLPDHLDPFYDDSKLEACKAHVKKLLGD
jgi:hypothetical protein